MIFAMALGIVLGYLFLAAAVEETGVIDRIHDRQLEREPMLFATAWDVETTTERIALSAAGVKAHETNSISSTSLQVVRARTPVWAVVVAVIFFPVGLIALGAKRRDVAVFAVRRTDSGTLVESSGRVSTVLRHELHRMATADLSTEVGSSADPL